MNLFEEALEKGYEEIEEAEEYILDFLLDSIDHDISEESLKRLQEDLELTDEEFQELEEKIVKHVDSKGKITKKKDRKTRARRATITTGRSKSSLKRSARKTARTKKRNPGGTRRALKKRKKAIRRRKQMGIK